MSWRSLLVLRLSSLGDILHTLPAVAFLRASIDRSIPIGWVVNQPYAALVESVGAADIVFPLPARQWRQAWWRDETRRDVSRMISELRAFSTGAATIDFQGLIKSASIGWMSGASVRYGFGATAIREKAALAFNNRTVPIDRSRHVVEWNLELAAALGSPAIPSVELDFSSFAVDESGDLEEIVQHPTITLVPGAGAARKCWPPEHFAALARAIKEQGVMEPLVVWGPGEEAVAQQIAERSGARLAPSTDLRALSFLLSRSRVVVGGDTGPLHLAAALGVPVIGLYGPTNPERNGPFGQMESVVRSPDPRGRMNAIGVNEVATAITLRTDLGRTSVRR